MRGKHIPDGYSESLLRVLLDHGLINSLDVGDDQVEGVLASLYRCRRADLQSGRLILDAAKVQTLLAARRHLQLAIAINRSGLAAFLRD